MVSIEKNKQHPLIKNIDWIIIITVLILNTLGLFAMKSVSDHLNQPSFFSKQLIASIIGIGCMAIIMMLDYKDFRFLSIIAYCGTVFLLVLVLIIGKGREEYGTKGWIDLGPASFQPSELGKITLTIVAAVFLERIKQGNGGLNYIWLGLTSAGLVVLVMLQPDFGTSVVYIFMLACMIFVFGIKYRIILITLGAGLISLPILWFSVLEKVFNTRQLNRILSFLNPDAYARTTDYQIRMAIRYIGSGMLTGVEKGTEKAAKNVPVVESDSIFAVIGEEWGFLGAVLVVVLFMVLLLRCLYISRYAKDQFGSYIVIGLMAMFLFHFVENIGMNLRMLPVTGIPLPFISYGGTYMIVCYIAIGIIVSISMRRQRPMFEA
ncbi:MAG: FtsW/RodA/SpoVE family cell cycle protein [Acetivibrionales bacterium]|jgi:rod shape determining protein RodA|nr:rod shape-determining protein RodA [Clostridiaceae bacterium]